MDIEWPQEFERAPGVGRAAPGALLNLSQPEQITKLYRSYVVNHDARQVLRHRGKSPRQAAFFFRNSELHFQAAQLASLYLMYGLLCGTERGLVALYRVGALESGILLCQAYEAYLELHAPAGISFEHAWFLLFALARRDEVGILRCDACGGVRLRDLLAKHRIACGNCGPAFPAAGKAQLAAAPVLPAAAGAPLISFATPC